MNITYAEVKRISCAFNPPVTKARYGTPEYHRAYRAFWYATRAYWRQAGCADSVDHATRKIGECDGELAKLGVPSYES